MQTVFQYVTAFGFNNLGEDVSDERIVINMVNSFLGRMHLASHLDYLNEHQMDLIREGVAYYNTLSEMKKTALPYFPLGFTNFEEKTVCAGLKNENKIYLAVWNLKGEENIFIPIPETVTDAKIAYPTKTSVQLQTCKDGLQLTYPKNLVLFFWKYPFKLSIIPLSFWLLLQSSRHKCAGLKILKL